MYESLLMFFSYATTLKMADSIKQLPPSSRMPTAAEMQMMRSILGDTPPSVTYELKRLVVPALAFALLSLPFADTALDKLVGSTTGIHLLIKTGIFIGIIVIAQLMGLA
jgi:hypothetical protein